MPAIRADLGGGISGAQWTIDACNVAFAAALLTSGSLGDRFGRRALLRLGLATFVAASIACAMAPSLPLLLAAYAFPGTVERARATAAWAIAAATSTALGPVPGGVLTDTLGWRDIFWLNAPVGLLALWMSHRYLAESRDPDAGRVDLPGQASAILGLATLTLVLVEGRTMAPTWAVALVILAAAGIGLFYWSQGRAESPILPLGLLRNRQLVAALLATFAMTFGTCGMLVVNSLRFNKNEARARWRLRSRFCRCRSPIWHSFRW